MRTTAKVKLYYKTDQHNGSYSLSFSPDYEDGRNAEWAHATPSLSLSMSVREDVAANFHEGQCFTLIFESEDAPQNAAETATEDDSTVDDGKA
jgi:hypothetical protein